MAVFHGGRTLQAIEEVCNYAGGLEVDVLEGVESLVLKNLLHQREDHNGEPRFWVLETINEFSREKLDDSGETAALQREHARYFLRFAESAATELAGTNQLEWSNRLKDEHDDMRAALNWAIDQGGSGDTEAVEIGLKIGTALNRFWLSRGYLREGREYLERLLVLADNLPCSKQSIARALHALSGHAWMQGDYAVATDMAQRTLAMGNELEDKQIIARALSRLGDVAGETAHFDESRSYFEQSPALFTELGDRSGIVSCLNNLGTMAHLQGDNTTARTLYLENLAIIRELGNKSLIATSLGNLSNVEFSLGDYAAARSSYINSLVISRDLEYTYNIAFCLGGLAGVSAETARPRQAARLIGAVDSILLLTGAAMQIEDRPPYERGIASAREQLGVEEYEKAWQEGRAMSMGQAIEYALEKT